MTGMTVEQRRDGSIVMASTTPLATYPRVLTERFAATTAAHPDRVMLGERAHDGGWRTMTYSEAWRAVRGIGQALLDRGLSADRPVAILSEGSIAHALLALGATHAGVPYCPVSPAYSLLAKTPDKLNHILALLRPGLIFVEDHATFANALARADNHGAEIVSNGTPPAGITPFSALTATEPTPVLDDAHHAIQPDDMRSILFTSGTTGAPKGVVNTHRMTCANQQMFVQTFPEFTAQPPELLSWLPWHHTSGANSILGSVVYNAGTLWIDNGKPIAGAPMDQTLANLNDIAPTAYFSAASGFRLLANALREDAALRARFYSRLAFFFYSGSAMPAGLAREMDEIAIAETGRAVPFYSCFGSTESAPFALAVNWAGATGGLVGLPMPGVTLKLAPVDGLLEARLQGPTVTPGYLNNADATAKAFDDEGFYRFGDALAPIDPAHPERGLAFDGRISENFKLTTGTWVNVAGLRDQVLTAAEGLLSDAVIAGEGHDRLGALLFPDPKRTAGLDQVALRDRLETMLASLATTATGSSTYIARALLMPEPPDAAAGEMTDKGAVNQRIVLRNRAEDVTRLFADPPGDALLHPAINAGQ